MVGNFNNGLMRLTSTLDVDVDDAGIAALAITTRIFNQIGDDTPEFGRVTDDFDAICNVCLDAYVWQARCFAAGIGQQGRQIHRCKLEASVGLA